MRTHPPILCALSLFVCLAGSAALPSLAVAAAPAAAAGGPRATLQRLNDDVDKRLRAKVVAGSAEDTRLKNEVKELASELLDYGELCKRALGEHWEKMPVGQRTDFVATLKELIERNYVKQLKTNLDYQVTYGEESTEGSEAKVTTTVKIATKGKATEALIEYRMIKQATGPTAGKWMVYDVVTDELSLVRNYRTQFQRIIAIQRLRRPAQQDEDQAQRRAGQGRRQARRSHPRHPGRQARRRSEKARQSRQPPRRQRLARPVTPVPLRYPPKYLVLSSSGTLRPPSRCVTRRGTWCCRASATSAPLPSARRFLPVRSSSRARL